MKHIIYDIFSRLRVAVLGGALIVAGSTLAFTHIAEAKEKAKTIPVRVVVDDTPVKRDSKAVMSVAPVVKEVSPSVVKVFTTTKAKVSFSQGESPFDDPFFRRFFGNPFDEGGRKLRAPKQHGLGSGVVVSKDGYILTNNHVVDNAERIKVALPPDNREYDAKVVGTDPKTDVAVLKIEAHDLHPLALADSDKIEVGDMVLAVGNPFGIGETVTMGIVSAKGRGNMGIEDYEDFIQTDAAINPGNSGGALVDLEGRLVGINTAILSQTGGNHGIGFAVPINLARHVMDELIEHGRVLRGFLGVAIQDLTPELAKEFHLPAGKGALVGDVTAGSPADKAGIRSGDVIVEFDGKPVQDSRHLKLQVAEVAPGTKTSLKVIRDGKEKEFRVALKELPGTKAMAKDSKVENESEHLNGVSVQDLDRATRSQLQIPSDVQGAVVSDVDQDSSAYEAGLRPGDVIEEIDHHKVTNADEAIALSEKIDHDKILLRVWSKGSSHYLVVDESKRG